MSGGILFFLEGQGTGLFAKLNFSLFKFTAENCIEIGELTTMIATTTIDITHQHKLYLSLPGLQWVAIV